MRPFLRRSAFGAHPCLARLTAARGFGRSISAKKKARVQGPIAGAPRAAPLRPGADAGRSDGNPEDTMHIDFDELIDRHGTHSMKWDRMEALYGVPAADGLAMWVADMDFRPPACVTEALRGMVDHGIYGYFGDDAAYLDAIRWWLSERHGWDVSPEWIFTTHGLVNGTAMCVDIWTDPGDGVVLFTPVYHAFAKVIRAAGREVVECEMPVVDGRHELDIAAWDAQMTGASAW
jgi:bifunctional pyridoxal-dependent enzyme with beta-cystathionase and maltose regulon repressor activities